MGVYLQISDIATATYHRLIKLVPNKSLDTSLLFHGQIYKLSNLHNLRIHES